MTPLSPIAAAGAPLLELLRRRRSVRRYSKDPVARADLDALFEAAQWAPSNHNRQPWKFLVLEDRARIEQCARDVASNLHKRLALLPALAVEHADDFCQHATAFAGAPVVVLALHKLPVLFAEGLLRDVPNPAWVSGEPLSVAMAVQNLLLAAHARGLGACVMTGPLLAPDSLRAYFPWPQAFAPSCLIALGHPVENPAPPRRKDRALIVTYLSDLRPAPESA